MESSMYLGDCDGKEQHQRKDVPGETVQRGPRAGGIVTVNYLTWYFFQYKYHVAGIIYPRILRGTPGLGIT